MNLALWLKRNGFRADQVQTFYPSPRWRRPPPCTIPAATRLRPVHRVGRQGGGRACRRCRQGPEQRRLHKAFLRYHDPVNWPILRDALRQMGREDLIGDGEQQLIPRTQPEGGDYRAPRRKNSAKSHQRRKQGGRAKTQHTGLPPRDDGSRG